MSAFVLAVIVTVLAGTSVSAHRRDEYLQAARLAVEPHRVELSVDLTPGIDVAESVIGDIDRNRDELLTADERRAYVSGVIDMLDLGIDGRPLQVELVAASFPELDSFRDGVGTIRLRLAARLPRLAEGDHQLVFRNRHHPEMSAYLANALAPDGDSIAITTQRRDEAQRNLAIAYIVLERGSALAPVWVLGVLCGVLLVLVTTRRSTGEGSQDESASCPAAAR